MAMTEAGCFSSF